MDLNRIQLLLLLFLALDYQQVSIHSLHLYNSSTGVLKNESDVFKGSNGNSGNLSWFCRFLIVCSVNEKSRNHYQKDCIPFRISLVHIRSVESLVTFYSPQGLTRIIVKNQDHQRQYFFFGGFVASTRQQILYFFLNFLAQLF